MPYRWVILFVAWIAFLLSFIDRLAWANVAVTIGESLGLTVAALGVAENASAVLPAALADFAEERATAGAA